MEPYLNLARLANASGVLSAPMELCPDLALLADVAEIVAARPALLSSPLEVELHRINATDVKLIMKKKLTMSDLNSNLGRLSIPQNKNLKDFLKQEEHHILENGKGIAVPVIEPCLRVTKLRFKKWAPVYVLTMGWKAVAQNNGLKAGELIQLWSFRTGGSVGFAVVKA